MPTLDWLGKAAVIKHHEEVPFHLLRPTRTVGAAESGNLLVQGDNLLALKALLPHYGGQVKCIYIDPPYNTGNENWLYNDAVNSPEMRAWLGKTVGREDLSRHDKWLCMMYPRLLLLRQFLREDGVIFVSIDDNEVANLKLIMDEIFGPDKFLAMFVWKKRSGSNDSKDYVSIDHEYVLSYRKTDQFTFVGAVKAFENYSNPDNDPRGAWAVDNLTCNKTKDERPNLYYDITDPKTGILYHANPNRVWVYERNRMERIIQENKVIFPKSGQGTPQYKRHLSEVRSNTKPISTWIEAVNSKNLSQQDTTILQTSINAQATKLLRQILGSQIFNYPKPIELVQELISQATERDDLVMDSFAGSGTTGHAVLQLNQQDGGNRRFILVEMEPHIAQNITATRLQRVIEGYTVTNDKGQQRYEHGLGGGLQCYELGETLFTPHGRIRETVTFEQLARHIFFSETRQPLPPITEKSPLLGTVNDQAVYLLYNGILHDKSPQGGNALTQATLQQLPPHDGAKVIYGSSCRLSAAKLQELNITFRQIPYQVTIR